MNVANGELDWVATLNDSQFGQTLRRMEQNVNRTTDGIINQGNQIESYANKAKQAVAAYFSVQAMTGFTQSLVEVRSQFQQLDIAFSTMLKSKAVADSLMKELVSFAATTPFGLKEAAGATKQLLAYGSTAKTVVGELRMLGDVASGVSVPIGDLVYLYGTLKTQGRAYAMDIRQFAGRGIPIYAELAKVLKINKDEVAGFVEAGKVGFPQVEQAFKNMTSSAGMFGGLMEAQSKSWSGLIERFKDAWDLMLNDIAKGQEGIFSESIESATQLVENYKQVLDILGLLIYTYGAYRAAIIATSIANSAAVASIGVYSVATRGLVVQETLSAASKRILISLQAQYNAVLAASPVGATVAALAALGAVIYALAQYTSAAEASQERLNDIQEEGATSAKKEANSVNNLVDVIKNHNATNEQRAAAYKKLQESTKGVLAGFSQEEIAAGKAKTAIDDYIKSIKEATIQRTAFNEFQKLNDQLAELDVKGSKAISMMDKAALRAKGLGSYINYSIAGFPESEKQRYLDSKAIAGFGGDADAALVRNERAKIEQQIKDLSKKYNTQITNELTKTSGQGDTDIVNGKKRSVDAIDNLIKKLKEEQSATAETSAQYQEYQKKIKVLEDEKAAITGKQSASSKKELSDRQKFLEELSNIEDEALRKGLTRNEEEIKAVQDKYEKLRIEARKNKLGPGVITRIDNLEIKETGDLEFRQNTEKLKTYLDEQKQLYSDYEAYKTDLGKEAADERFKNEMDLSLTYLEELKIREAELLSKGRASLSGPETERLLVIQKAIKDETEAEQQKYDDLVKEFVSYNDQRKRLTENYNSDMAILAKNPEAKAARTKAYQEELRDLDDANVKKLDTFKELYEGIDRLSDAGAKRVLDRSKELLQQLVDDGKISAELAKEIALLIKDSEENLGARLPERLINIANQIDQIASSVQGIDEAFSKVLSTLGNVIGQVGNIKRGFADLKAAQSSKDTLGQLGAGLGIFGAGISIVSSVISLFDKSAEKAAQRERQDEYSRNLQLKQIDASNRALERQLELVNEVYGVDRLTRYAEGLKSIEAKQKDLSSGLEGKYQMTGSTLVDSILKNVNAGKKLDFFSQQFFDGFKIVPGLLKELPKDLESLRKLMDAGLLDEGTAKMVESLILLEKQAITTKNALNMEKVGSSLDNIADIFLNTLTDGTQDFGKSFEEIIQKSLMNSFKGEITRKYLQSFYDQLALAADPSSDQGSIITKAESDALRASYLKAGEDRKAELAAMEEITGIKLTAEVEIDADFESFQSKLLQDVLGMGNNMQDIIKDSILEGFQAQMSTDGLKTFYDKLKAYQKDGAVLTKAQVAELNEEYATFLSTYKGKLSALEEATGISFSELVNAETAAIDEGLRILQDGISSLIDSGKISAEDFGKNFEEVIKKAVLEGLKAEIFVDGLKSLNEKIREFQKQGTPFTKEQIEKLRADYLSFTEDVQARLAALTEATGISFSEIVEQQVQAVDDGLKTLQDGMFALFQNGTISAQDFGDQFQHIIRNAILTGFQTQVFANGLKVFYDNLQALQASNGSLTPAEIAELRQQYDAFVNDAKAKYEELERITGISLSKPVAQVIETAKETIDTEFESLVDTIAGVFGNMTGAGEEFGAKFEDIMKKAVLNSFKTQYLTNALKGFYDQLNVYTANGATLSQVQIASLKEQYDAIIKGGKERIKEIENATGIDFESELSSDPGLKGKLGRELQETTASEFLGVSRASFEQHKINAITNIQLLAVAKSNLSAIERHTFRIAENTQVLHQMAKDIKKMSGGRLVADKFDLGL